MDLKRDLDPKLTRSVFDLNIAKVQITSPPKKNLLCSSLSFPDRSVGKEFTYNTGDPSSIPGSGRSAREGIDHPLQYSWTSLGAQLLKNLPAMQETWVSPWVGMIPWRREGLPTPVFWPGEDHELYSPWGCKELDMTE